MSEKTVDPQQLKDQQRLDWDAAAAGWKKWWPVFERSAQHVSDRLVELAGVAAGAYVLDVATGNGEPALTAARRVGSAGRVIATDQSDGMLAIARERAAALGLANVEFRQTDGEALGIAERDFDAIVCRWGLMFMPDVKAALRAMHQRLRVGGRLATAVWAAAGKVPMISIGADAVRRIAGLPPPPPMRSARCGSPTSRSSAPHLPAPVSRTLPSSISRSLSTSPPRPTSCNFGATCRRNSA